MFAILFVGLFGSAVWCGAEYEVINCLATQTDVNNWIIALCAWVTGMIIGTPFTAAIKSLG